MIIKHYYYFKHARIKSKLNEENWDILRTDSQNPDFSLENTVEEYEKNCISNKTYLQFASLISQEFQEKQHSKVTSLGVGKAILEWHLKKLNPLLHITCTDYTSNAINKLKMLFKDCDNMMEFDILNGDYSIFDAPAPVIMYRISTEFNKTDWITIFEKMNQTNIQNIIFVPTEIGSFKVAVHEKLKHMKNLIKYRDDVFCGWIYNEKEFFNFWNNKYELTKKIPLNNSAIYFLKIK